MSWGINVMKRLLVLCITFLFMITACQPATKSIGIMYYKLPDEQSASLKIFLSDDHDSINQIIITRTLDTEMMKKQAQTEDFQLAKSMLLESYLYKENNFAHLSPYVTVCNTCKLLDDTPKESFLTVYLSDSIKQIDDKRFESSKYFNYIEKYWFNFKAAEFDWNNSNVLKILSDFGLLNAIDQESKVIRYSLLRDDDSSLLQAFFKQGEQAEIMSDGSYKRLKQSD